MHVAEVKESAVSVEFENWLNDGERQRAARFAFKQHSRLFVAARGLLRRTVGAFVGVDPRDLEFVLGPFGKPRLMSGQVEFNVSHSKGIALVAVGTRPLGVDVEVMQHNIDFAAVAATVFSTNEQDALACSSGPERMESFYRIWTRKEAFIKAVGDGLAFPLGEFDVSAVPNGGLIDCRVPPHDSILWTLRSLDIDLGYAAALAVAGKVDRLWRWELSDHAQLRLVNMLVL